MTPIPRNLFDMPVVTLKELRGYVAEVWSGRHWDVWITTQGQGRYKTVSVHIGGKEPDGTVMMPAETYHGRNRQQAMLRAWTRMVALLQRGTLQTFGYGIEGLNALRGRMGLELLEVGNDDRKPGSRKPKGRRKPDKALQPLGARDNEGKR